MCGNPVGGRGAVNWQDLGRLLFGKGATPLDSLLATYRHGLLCGFGLLGLLRLIWWLL